LHGARASQVVEGVQGGADRAAGEEHVVDEDYGPPVDAFGGNVGAAEGAGRGEPQVVAVHGDVEGAPGDRALFDAFDAFGEPLREGHASGADAQKGEVVAPFGAFEDLVGDAGQRPGDLGAFQNRSSLVWSLTAGMVVGMHKRTSFPASLDRSLKDVGRLSRYQRRLSAHDVAWAQHPGIMRVITLLDLDSAQSFGFGRYAFFTW